MRRAGALLLLAACRNFGEPPLHLAVSPPALTFTGLAGGIGPPAQALIVDAIGGSGGRVSWAASADVPWLAVAPTSDTAPALAWVTVRVPGLASGVHTGSLTVETTEPRMQVSVPVTLALASAVSLTGRWTGATSTVALTLAIAQTDSTVTGTGTLSPPLASVRVTGLFRTPQDSVALQLTGDSLAATFSGSLVDENTIRGVLDGGGLSRYPLTVFRQ